MRARIALAALAFVLFPFQATRADTPAQYPAKPITLVVGFAPGGESDRIARVLAAALEPALGREIVVQNRPGAGGEIAARHVANAAADGYTLFLASMGPLAVDAALPDASRADIAREFAPISLIATFDQVLVVHPSVPARSLSEFVGYARTHPGQVSYASTGIGSASHLAGLLLQRVTHVRLLHVPYQGALNINRDLIAGNVLASFAPAVPIRPYVEARQLRALASTGRSRLPNWPELPTVAELGYPDFEVTDWYCLAAPAATSVAILERLNEVVVRFLESPDTSEKFALLGMRAAPSTRKEAASFIERERRRWTELLQDRSK